MNFSQTSSNLLWQCKEVLHIPYLRISVVSSGGHAIILLLVSVSMVLSMKTIHYQRMKAFLILTVMMLYLVGRMLSTGLTLVNIIVFLE